jgi:hypothetical protein
MLGFLLFNIFLAKKLCLAKTFLGSNSSSELSGESSSAPSASLAVNLSVIILGGTDPADLELGSEAKRADATATALLLGGAFTATAVAVGLEE